MFSQSQMIIVHFPEWFDPVVWWCVRVCVWHQVLHCIKGSLLWLEASWSLWEDRAWCFVSSNLSCNIKCKYRWKNEIKIYIFCDTLIHICLSISSSLFFQDWIWAGHWIWKHGPLGRLSRYESHLHAMPSIQRHIQTYTQIYIHWHTHVRKCIKNSSPHTPWACTLTPVTTSVTCPYISLCAVLTHTSAYSTWPPVTYAACEAGTWTCTIRVMFSRCKW